eukprot:scaffold14102_cov128-Isochrysis_galbana.AAC.8
MFDVIAGPGVPRPRLNGAGCARRRGCVLFVRNDCGTCVRVALPLSWEAAPVRKLSTLLAQRWALPVEEVHLESPRGPLADGQLLHAAIVPRETLYLKSGPAPAAATSDEPPKRPQLWVWGRRVDGCVSLLPEPQPGLSVHQERARRACASSPPRRIGRRVLTRLTRLAEPAPCPVAPFPLLTSADPHTPHARGRQVQAVALGAEHALLVTRDGLALSWGSNGSGQLGTGDEEPRSLPAVVRLLAATRCVVPSCGARCSGVVDASGRLWTWGEHQPANAPSSLHSSWINRHGATECGLGVREVAFGQAHAILLTTAGAVWTWGYNTAYCLGWAAAAGPGSALRHGFQKPREPLQLPPATAVAAGALHSAAVAAEGLLYAWGDNSVGQCGCGGGGCITLPAPVSAFDLTAEPVARVRCVGGTTIVITRAGRCYMLGGGSQVEVGGESDDDMPSDASDASENEMDPEGDTDWLGGGEARAAPWRCGLPGALGLKRLLAEDVADVATAQDHALIIGHRRPVRGMGYNRYGQALPGSRRLRLGAPVPFPLDLFNGARLSQLAAGGGASAAVSEGVENLAARCTAALLSALRSSDVVVCAQLLDWGLGCDTPEAKGVERECLRCVEANRMHVEAVWRSAGLPAARLDAALEQMRDAARDGAD